MHHGESLDSQDDRFINYLRNAFESCTTFDWGSMHYPLGLRSTLVQPVGEVAINGEIGRKRGFSCGHRNYCNGRTVKSDHIRGSPSWAIRLKNGSFATK